MEAPAPEAEAALAVLQLELASRQSVLHFAHSAVSTILALIAAGTVAKLYWDLDRKPSLEVFIAPVAALSGVCFVYGFIRYLIGRRVLKQELESFAKLQSLRRQLKLEDPSTLLPQ